MTTVASADIISEDNFHFWRITAHDFHPSTQDPPMQTQHSHDQYLETQVMTASPQKLRLMLIEGALRFGRQSLECWDDNPSEALRLISRTRDIVTELLSGTSGVKDEVGIKSKEIYMFLFRQIALAQLQVEPEKLREVLEVLEIERETWHQVCEIMPEAAAQPEQKTTEVTAADYTPPESVDSPQNIIPPAHFPGSGITTPQGGFSLDA